jgi:hypothetical protein
MSAFIMPIPVLLITTAPTLDKNLMWDTSNASLSMLAPSNKYYTGYTQALVGLISATCHNILWHTYIISSLLISAPSWL